MDRVPFDKWIYPKLEKNRSIMRKAVENLVSKFAGKPEAVEVSEISYGNTVSIEVRVAKEDMGKLIGKRGRTVRAIRSLLYFAGQKQRRKYVLNIIED